MVRFKGLSFENVPPEAKKTRVFPTYFQSGMLSGNRESHLKLKKNLAPTGARGGVRNIINAVFGVFGAPTPRKYFCKKIKNKKNKIIFLRV